MKSLKKPSIYKDIILLYYQIIISILFIRILYYYPAFMCKFAVFVNGSRKCVPCRRSHLCVAAIALDVTCTHSPTRSITTVLWFSPVCPSAKTKGSVSWFWPSCTWADPSKSSMHFRPSYLRCQFIIATSENLGVQIPNSFCYILIFLYSYILILFYYHVITLSSYYINIFPYYSIVISNYFIIV